MRPYYAVVKDSFREALRSPVLWILIALITLILLGLAPFGVREVANVEFHRDDVKNWKELGERMNSQYAALTPSPGKRLWQEIDPELRTKILQLEPPARDDQAAEQKYRNTVRQFRKRLNALIEQPDLYDPVAWSTVKLNREARELQQKGVKTLTETERLRFHRLAIENAYPDLFRGRPKTSFVMSYGPWDELWPSPLPISRDDFHKVIGTAIAFVGDIIVGLVVVFVAILITAPLIPRMFDQGQLHLMLSKPVSRSMLLIAQFFGGCAYVLLLTSYLVIGLILILGTRIGYWNAKLLWMIPVYVFMFAIYYTVSTASAVLWRSTLMSIISGVLFFIVTFLLGTSKVVIEDGILTLQRVTQIVPVGKHGVLVVNERGMVNRWSNEDLSWKVTFLPQEFEGVGNMATFMPAAFRAVGPIYMPQRDAILAVQYPNITMRGPVNAVPQITSVGRASNEWTHNRGASPPVGTFAIFREAEGPAIFVSNLGVSRLVRDPTTKAEPQKVLGMSLPLPSASPFVDALATTEKVQFATPARAAYHAPSHTLVVYSQGELTVLSRNAELQYEVAKQQKLDAEVSESVALATTDKWVLVGRADGRLQLFDTKTLEEVSTTTPQRSSSPRFVAASEDGRFAVVFHNGRLWTYDPQAAAWRRANVRGQGDISTATYDGNDLWVSAYTDRITRYNSAGEAIEHYTPALSFFQTVYYYLIRPAYTILPKPGEMGKTLQYVLTGKETVDGGDGESRNDVTAIQAKLNPWAPVWSGLLFMGVVLTATCVYFERQEY